MTMAQGRNGMARAVDGVARESHGALACGNFGRQTIADSAGAISPATAEHPRPSHTTRKASGRSSPYDFSPPTKVGGTPEVWRIRLLHITLQAR
jgi:hypothetical protein